ncbi:MAG: LapA family protein [Nitrosomonas sp.]|nr:LapA family protein [Nitrosomonas sp.]MDP1950320.1 LapA family protein [Nitrosomonas sp.]
MMRYLVWSLRLFVFLVFVAFAAKNSDPVTLSYYLGYAYELPLSIALLIFFALGTGCGYLSAYANKPKNNKPKTN